MALRNTIQTGVRPSCARSGSPLVPRSPPGPVTPRPPHLSAPGTGAHTATLRLRHGTCEEKARCRAVSSATRPPVSLLTPYCPGRFKGPFGSPLIVPTFTYEASASRSRPQRIVRFRRRAILRRFVPHPRKMANTRRLVLAKASHPRTNRRGRLVPLRGIRIRVQFPQTRRPPVPFKRQELAYGSKPPTAVGAGGPQGVRQSPPSIRAQNSAPTAVGTCHTPCFIGPPALQKSAQEYRCLTATRCPARHLRRKEKARCRSRASLRVLRSFYGLPMVQGASKGRSLRRLMLQLHPKGGRFALADPPGHTGGPVSYRPEGRNPPPWFSFSNSVVSSGPFKRQERTRSAVAALEVPHSRDWKWRTADWHPRTRHRSGLKVPPRPLSAAGMPSAKCCAILTEERGGRPGNASSPLSFPPFGNPPFLIPPPNSNPPKGGKPQGALARRLLWRG